MIGVVGPGRSQRIASAIERAGTNTVVGEATAVLGADPDLVVAVGRASVIDLVRAGIEVPVAPVEVEGGPTLETTVERAERLAGGEYETRRWPTFGVDRGGERVARAAFDAMLVTSDPASISEYEVRAGELEEALRADGIAIATPAGSHGYAGAAGGPTVVAEDDVASIVPVGTFRMERPRWTYDLGDPIEVDVAREEEAVTLLVDGRDAGEVEAGIEVAPAASIEALLPVA